MSLAHKPASTRAQRILLRCAPSVIADVHAIVEACDNVAVVRTLDPEQSVVEIIATPDTFADALGLAQSLERILGAEILHPRPGAASGN